MCMLTVLGTHRDNLLVIGAQQRSRALKQYYHAPQGCWLTKARSQRTCCSHLDEVECRAESGLALARRRRRRQKLPWVRRCKATSAPQ